MNIKRDKFLTEQMGGLWLTTLNMGMVKRPSCNEATTTQFSNWDGFGKLWEWAQKQSWFYELKGMCNGTYMEGFMTEEEPHDWVEEYINPDCFADAVYEFLVSKKFRR